MNKNKKIAEAIDNSQALVQMYQAGYLDGFKSNKVKGRISYKKLNLECSEAFEKRFKINNRIKKQ